MSDDDRPTTRKRCSPSSTRARASSSRPGPIPEEAAIALLTSQLGARAIDRR